MNLTTQTPEATGSLSPAHASPEQSNIAKLLLNGWTAEYALRLKPVSADRDYLNNALSWVFPQAYFAVLFSARAVLAVDDIRIANPEVIENLINRWCEGGKYGQGFTATSNPFTEVMAFRIKGTTQPRRLSGPEAAALHVRLTERVHAIALIHETYILNRLGADAYCHLIDRLPSHFRNGFVGARATLLLSDD